MRPLLTRFAFALLVSALGAGCSPSVPASAVVLEVEPPAAASMTPAHLEFSWYDTTGVRLRARRLPGTGEFTPADGLLARLRIELSGGVGERRLHVLAYGADDTLVGEAIARWSPGGGSTSVLRISLQPNRLPDRDEDGVPDEIDVCPIEPNVEQAACPMTAPDGGAPTAVPDAGGRLDSAPGPDAALPTPDAAAPAMDAALMSGPDAPLVVDSGAAVDSMPAPAPRTERDDFERGTLAGWDAEAGVWEIATDGTKVAHGISAVARLLRQNSDSRHQMITVRGKAQNDATTQRELGVVLRFVDGANYYYLGLDGAYAQIWRKQSDVVTMLARVPFSWSEKTWYTLRGEAMGDTLRLSVDGNVVVMADDGALRRGRVGLRSSSVSSWFDDVVIEYP